VKGIFHNQITFFAQRLQHIVVNSQEGHTHRFITPVSRIQDVAKTPPSVPPSESLWVFP
jgi:hypothetical protein